MSSPLMPLRLAIAGIGGFAASHHRAIIALEAAGHCRLVCTCDPRAETLQTEQTEWRFTERGVRVFADYAEMLAACRDGLDYVVVSTPIPLHAPMHAGAVAAGVAVYLEKPPTLDPAELERMIAVEAAARVASVVAFNYIVEAPRLALKQRLLDGEFGAIRRAALRAFSPRATAYFQRAPWAGRLMIDDRLALDSCLGNALAHSTHNLLFWSGRDGLWCWDEPASVRATLHRAHAIEGADTFFVETRLRSGVELRIAVTHAGYGRGLHEEIVECEHARLRCEPNRSLEVLWHDGRREYFDCTGFDGVVENHLAYHRHLRGETPRPATTLADSRPFVALQALAHLAADRIVPFARQRIGSHPAPTADSSFLEVEGLAGSLDAFAAGGPWPEGEPRHVATPRDLPRLNDAIRDLRKNHEPRPSTAG